MADDNRDHNEDTAAPVIAVSPEFAASLRETARTLQAHAEVFRGFRSQFLSVRSDVEILRETMQRLDIAGTLKQYQARSEALSEALRNAAPAVRQFREIQRQIAESIEPWRRIFPNQRAWQESLSARLALLPTNVVLADPGRTIEGFVRLSRISDATHDPEPFSKPVEDLLEEEFGDVAGAIEKTDSPEARDAAAVDAGLNPDLIAFEPSAYPNVLVCAGFKFDLPPLALPVPIEGKPESPSFDPSAWLLLKYLENALRVVIERKLREAAGDQWVRQRVPQPLRELWQQRQQADRDQNREVYDLIYYADFTDMRTLIQQRNNWRDAFASVFPAKEDVMESLRRLPSIRNNDAHSRPLSRVDTLFLTSEATRLIGALRKAGLLK